MTGAEAATVGVTGAGADSEHPTSVNNAAQRTTGPTTRLLRTAPACHATSGAVSMSAYCGGVRIALAVVGVVVTLFGVLFTLQGVGIVGGSPMTGTMTWSVLGPIIAIVGILLAVGSLRFRR